MFDSELIDELALLALRLLVVLLHTLHAIGWIAGGAIVTVTVVWTVEEIFEVHKGARVIKARHEKEKKRAA